MAFLDRWRFPSRERLRLFAGAWLSLVAFAVLDAFGLFGPDIGVLETLRVSSLSRTMFLDIGLLSTLAAAWALLDRRHPSAPVFAVLMLFLGSFALLPYLVLRERALLAKT